MCGQFSSRTAILIKPKPFNFYLKVFSLWVRQLSLFIDLRILFPASFWGCSYPATQMFIISWSLWPPLFTQSIWMAALSFPTCIIIVIYTTLIELKYLMNFSTPFSSMFVQSIHNKKKPRKVAHAIYSA